MHKRQCILADSQAVFRDLVITRPNLAKAERYDLLSIATLPTAMPQILDLRHLALRSTALSSLAHPAPRVV